MTTTLKQMSDKSVPKFGQNKVFYFTKVTTLQTPIQSMKVEYHFYIPRKSWNFLS